MDQTFEKEKKVIYDFICDDFYVPMKIKRDRHGSSDHERTEKRASGSAGQSGEEGKISLSSVEIQQGSDEKNHGNLPGEYPWIWICYGRGEDEDIFIPARECERCIPGR